MSLFTHDEFVASLDDLNEVGAPPAPRAVGDNVGRVGAEWSVVRVELARVVTATVVVRVADRRHRTDDHAPQTNVHLKAARNFVDHLVTAALRPFPS